MNTTPDFCEILCRYERLSEPGTEAVGLTVMELMTVAPGERVVDVATGTGAMAVAVAERGVLGLATDVAPPMVAPAQGRPRPTGSASADADKLASFPKRHVGGIGQEAV